MAKQLPAHYFQFTAEYAYTEWACELPAGMDVAQLFNPVTWGNHHKKFNPGDRIRIRSNDGQIDIMVVVDAVTVGGVHVSEWPKFLGATGGEAVSALAAKVKEATPTIVPLDTDGSPKVRVQYLPATGWRVLGLNGEVVRNLKSEAEAVDKMNEYLRQAGLKMPEPKPVEAASPEPTPEEPAAETPERKPARKAAKKEVA